MVCSVEEMYSYYSRCHLSCLGGKSRKSAGFRRRLVLFPFALSSPFLHQIHSIPIYITLPHTRLSLSHTLIFSYAHSLSFSAYIYQNSGSYSPFFTIFVSLRLGTNHHSTRFPNNINHANITRQSNGTLALSASSQSDHRTTGTRRYRHSRHLRCPASFGCRGRGCQSRNAQSLARRRMER
jgi:hypothetical protein